MLGRAHPLATLAAAASVVPDGARVDADR